MTGQPEPSDAALAAEVGTVVAEPRQEPADSFVLHAPLELAARTALLPLVSPDGRDRARARLRSLASEFAAAGPPVGPPADRAFDSPAAAAERLVTAIEAADLDEVDAVAAWLGRTATPVELATLLADDLVPRLSAAAHGPIFLYHLPRVAPRGELSGELLRPLAREVARNPDWRLRWIDDADPAAVAGSAPAPALADAVLRTPRLGSPGSDFIFPLMDKVDGSYAAGLLGPVTSVDSMEDFRIQAQMLLRAAALSMLQEPPDHAPYGWSHCLTMPQAVLGLVPHGLDPGRALAVAATHVVGFRSGLGSRDLSATYAPEPPGIDVFDALDADPATAAAAAWHAPGGSLVELVSALATRASAQRDAHLVKYTLACLDAADADRPHARLFLAAAASLSAWWSGFDDPNDPLRA